MFYSKIKISLLLILLSSFVCIGQEKKNDSLVTLSIYQSGIETINLNSKYKINEKLNLSSYKFVLLDIKSFEEGYLSFPLTNGGNKPSKYIYDSYNKIYSNQFLQKSFFKVSELYKVREIGKK
jgi:hypothetical protein